MSFGQWMLLVALSVLWGGSFFFVGVAVKELPPFTLAFVRVAIAALILMPIVIARGRALPSGARAWWPFLVMGTLNNLIPFVLIALAQKEIASGLASVLNATTPLWSVLLAHLFSIETMKANRLAGVILGVVGVAVLVGPEMLVGRSVSALAVMCALGATLSYGFSGVWGRRFKSTPPLISAISQLLCSSLLLLPLALLFEQPWALPTPSLEAVAAVVGLASLSTALAYIVFFRVMAVSGATNVMLVTLLIPISAIALGTTLLGETILPRHIAGALIIGSALLVIDGRLLGRGRLDRPA